MKNISKVSHINGPIYSVSVGPILSFQEVRHVFKVVLHGERYTVDTGFSCDMKIQSIRIFNENMHGIRECFTVIRAKGVGTLNQDISYLYAFSYKDASTNTLSMTSMDSSYFLFIETILEDIGWSSNIHPELASRLASCLKLLSTFPDDGGSHVMSSDTFIEISQLFKNTKRQGICTSTYQRTAGIIPKFQTSVVSYLGTEHNTRSVIEDHPLFGDLMHDLDGIHDLSKDTALVEVLECKDDNYVIDYITSKSAIILHAGSFSMSINKHGGRGELRQLTRALSHRHEDRCWITISIQKDGILTKPNEFMLLIMPNCNKTKANSDDMGVHTSLDLRKYMMR